MKELQWQALEIVNRVIELIDRAWARQDIASDIEKRFHLAARVGQPCPRGCRGLGPDCEICGRSGYVTIPGASRLAALGAPPDADAQPSRETATPREEALSNLIWWMLGERDAFPPMPPHVEGAPRRNYWWRRELRDRFDAIYAKYPCSGVVVAAAPSRSTPAPQTPTRYRIVNGVTPPESPLTTEGVDHPYAGPIVYLASEVDSLLASRPAVEATPPADKFCDENAHSFGPCQTCGMPHLASRLETPTADDIAWAARAIHDENISDTGSHPEAVHYGEFETCDAPSCAAVRAAAVPPGAADAPQGQAEVEAFDNRLHRRAYERLALCPDHRDKANGRCIVCVAEERTRQEVAADAVPSEPQAVGGSVNTSVLGMPCGPHGVVACRFCWPSNSVAPAAQREPKPTEQELDARFDKALRDNDQKTMRAIAAYDRAHPPPADELRAITAELRTGLEKIAAYAAMQHPQSLIAADHVIHEIAAHLQGVINDPLGRLALLAGKEPT